MHKAHVIVQYFNILQVIQFGVRRAKEGIVELRVNDFVIKEDELWGIKTWGKVKIHLAKKVE